jgi:DNA ligase (NAD+)
MEFVNKDKKSLTVPELEKLILFLSDKYYNDEELVSDQEYDKIVEILKEKNSKSLVLKSIGAPVRKDVVKVNLPAWLGSLDKVKNDSRELELWLQKYDMDIQITDKLDGISALYDFSDGKKKLYTRGNGSIGQDISFLVDYLNLPLLDKDIMVRGELIMTKKNFSEKYQNIFPKARSVVAGIVNSKKPDLKIIKDIEFIAYELIDDKYNFTPEEQMKILTELNFNVVHHEIKNNLNSEKLEKILERRKKESKYEIDGLVLTSNDIYMRNESGNPKYSVAFKKNEEGILTEVIEVLWNASKYRVLVPRLHINPVIIDGDTVQYCTAFNAKYIWDNNIGKGTKIKIVKSGDVIPYISEIVKSTKAQMPKEKNYTWNESGVDIILSHENDDVVIKKLASFFKVLEVENLSEATIRKLVNAGYDDIDRIYHMRINDIICLEGFAMKSSKKLYDNIHEKLDKPIELEKIMSASMIFGHGFGTRRFIMLLEKIPKIYKREKITLEEILEVEGFSEITSNKFLDNYENFWIWLDEHPYLKIKKEKKEKKEGYFSGKNVVLTGFRDKKLEEKIISQGGKIQNSVNKLTNLVITKDNNNSSSKIKKAQELNIKIISLQELEK